MTSPRIVSLIASSTEIVCALGFEKDLVGRSHECDFPTTVTSLPVCTAPRFAVTGTSAEIDRLVKDTLSKAPSVYEVDAKLLESLEPDVILTQSQCEVCAVSLRDVEAAVCTFGSRRPTIVALEPHGLEDLAGDIRRVAEALGAKEQAETLVKSLDERMASLARRVASLPRPTIACIEWIEPLMAAGNWVPQLAEKAGGQNLFGEAGKHSPWMTMEALVAKDPEVIAVMPCGFDLERTRSEMAALTSRREWTELRAVRERRVFLTDGNQYFNRPGPRLVDSLEILAEILHPGQIEPHHEGSGWQRL